MTTDVLAALRRLTAECMDESGALLRPSLAAVRQAQAALARGIDSGEAGETRGGSTPKGQEPGAREGTRPEEIAQPSLHIEPAGWIENGKWRPNPLWSWAGPQTVAWSIPLYPVFPSSHIEPVAGSPAAQFHRNFVASRRSIKRERGAAPSDAALSPTEEEPLSPTSEVLSALGMTREVCSLALAVLGSIHPEGTDPYVMEAERRIRAIESKVRAGTLTGPEGAS